MADTVVDFINTTSNYASLSSGITIVSNAASEQAVIKDIELNNPKGRTFNYTVGNVIVVSSSASRLTGTELVGSSRSLVMTTPAKAVANGLLLFLNSTTEYYPSPFVTVFDTDTPSVISSSTSTVSISPSLSTTPYFCCFGANGDFYYGNNLSSALYRRVGSIQGSESQVITSNNASALSFDGRYIYGFQQNSTVMTVYDTLNNVQQGTGAISGFPGGLTFNSQNCSAALDGYVVLRNNGSPGNPLILVNGLTRTTITTVDASLNSTLRCNIAFGKNSIGNYYAVFGAGAPLLRAVGFGNNLTSPSVTSVNYSTSAGAGWNLNENLNSNGYVRNPNAPRIIWGGVGQNTMGYIDLDSFITSPSGSLSAVPVQNLTGNASNTAVTFTVNSTQASTDFGTVAIRATGIKTT
jgi:hypothetical protein